MIRVLSLDYVSFQQIRTLAPPFPPVGLVAAPCGSPAVSHLHRYYEVVRLLSHPSVLPSVDPWLHVSPDPNQRRSSWCGRGWGALLGSRPASSETCPGLWTPPTPAQPRIAVAAECCLPPREKRRHRNKIRFRCCPSWPASSLCTLRTHQSPGEWQHVLLTCLLDFGQTGFAPARLDQEVSLTRHQFPLFRAFPNAIPTLSLQIFPWMLHPLPRRSH